MFKGIKELFGNYFLLKEFAETRRNISVANLENAKTIGILFDSSDPEEFELVKRYVLYLKDWKKKVKAIGFFSQKKIPNLTYSKLEYDFFTLKELNWYHKPSNIYIRNFIHEETDVLIDLNIHDRFPLKYISAMSKAKFKIGKYSDADKFIYDMMIETDKKQGMKYFLRQVDTYLQMVNKNVDNSTNSVVGGISSR